MNFTEEEKKLLTQYQKLSNSMPTFLNRLAVELIPPAICIAIWLITGQSHWLLIVVVISVAFNVRKVVGQRNNIDILKSISIKAIGEVTSEK